MWHRRLAAILAPMMPKGFISIPLVAHDAQTCPAYSVGPPVSTESRSKYRPISPCLPIPYDLISPWPPKCPYQWCPPGIPTRLCVPPPACMHAHMHTLQKCVDIRETFRWHNIKNVILPEMLKVMRTHMRVCKHLFTRARACVLEQEEGRERGEGQEVQVCSRELRLEEAGGLGGSRSRSMGGLLRGGRGLGGLLWAPQLSGTQLSRVARDRLTICCLIWAYGC